jgi:hypothetical protein
MKNTVINVNNKKELLAALHLLTTFSGLEVSGSYKTPEAFADQYPEAGAVGLQGTGSGRTIVGWYGKRSEGYSFSAESQQIMDELLEHCPTIKVDKVGDYTATVTLNNIQVGCQTISFAKFDEIAAAVAKIRADS